MPDQIIYISVTSDGGPGVQSGISLRQALGSVRKGVIGAESDGKLYGLEDPVRASGDYRLLTVDSPRGMELFWHSSSHLLAQAVLRLYPHARLGIGPAIKDGFYYDFDFGQPISSDDLSRIEDEMRREVVADYPIVRAEIKPGEAKSLFSAKGQTYKVELIEGLNEQISTYTQGEFTDLCRGPHVPSTGYLKHFKLLALTGAYWRGDEHNPMLQRIYGTAFPTKELLEARLHQIEEAKKRDHRKLGQELELFTFSEEVGKGLPLWLPNGTILREELEKLAKEEEFKDGYVRVATPEITKDKLYYMSGHLPYYADDMYKPIEIEEELYYLTPMNCPHHHMIYLSRPRSYRDLPVRLAEYGHCYRFERSGTLTGLMRTRGFCQNDAHIYCRYDQAKAEFLKVLQLHARLYEVFGIKNYYMRFSKPDLAKLDKYVNEPEKWIEAMQIIQEVMDESGYPYVEAAGDAAFYGPKIDFIIESAIGNEYAISTNQLDFLASGRFNLHYVGEDNSEHPVYVIHRAPLGSHERFVAFLIEHYAGAFPTWLAPIQAILIPIADRHTDYAYRVKEELLQAGIPTSTGGIRLEIDQSRETLQKKIRNASAKKAPYLLIMGDNEAANGTVSVRLRGGKELRGVKIEEFAARVKQEVLSRKDFAIDTE